MRPKRDRKGKSPDRARYRDNVTLPNRSPDCRRRDVRFVRSRPRPDRYQKGIGEERACETSRASRVRKRKSEKGAPRRPGRKSHIIAPLLDEVVRLSETLRRIINNRSRPFPFPARNKRNESERQAEIRDTVDRPREGAPTIFPLFFFPLLSFYISHEKRMTYISPDTTR